MRKIDVSPLEAAAALPPLDRSSKRGRRCSGRERSRWRPRLGAPLEGRAEGPQPTMRKIKLATAAATSTLPRPSRPLDGEAPLNPSGGFAREAERGRKDARACTLKWLIKSHTSDNPNLPKVLVQRSFGGRRENPTSIAQIVQPKAPVDHSQIGLTTL